MVVTSRCFAFRALITQAQIWKRQFELKNSKSLLYSFPPWLKLERSLETCCVNFFRLSWHFKREKPVFWKASFLQNKDWLRVQASRLVRISLLINALNKRVLLFFLGKLFYKSNRKLFSCVCISWYKHLRGWHKSRQLCKPSTLSRVCITVSNSPNPSPVYIRLCKHGKLFLLLKKHIGEERSKTICRSIGQVCFYGTEKYFSPF